MVKYLREISYLRGCRGWVYCNVCVNVVVSQVAGVRALKDKVGTGEVTVQTATEISRSSLIL